MSIKRTGKFIKYSKEKEKFQYEFEFKIFDSFLEDQPDVELETKKHSIKVTLEDTTGKSWIDNLEDGDLPKVLTVYAVNRIRKILEKGDNLKSKEEFTIPRGDLPEWAKDSSSLKEPNRISFKVLIPEQKPDK